MRKFKVAILVLSDSCYRGLKEDASGKEIERILRSSEISSSWEVVCYEILPDQKETIKRKLIGLTDEIGVDLVVTTGGTGVSRTDVTPEATKEVIDKEIPGIQEMIRMECYKRTPTAVLSRGVCGVRNKSLILNLPGSSKAVRESLPLVLPLVPHIIELLHGHTDHN